jgi:hypothetical protein
MNNAVASKALVTKGIDFQHPVFANDQRSNRRDAHPLGLRRRKPDGCF